MRQLKAAPAATAIHHHSPSLLPAGPMLERWNSHFSTTVEQELFGCVKESSLPASLLRCSLIFRNPLPAAADRTTTAPLQSRLPVVPGPQLIKSGNHCVGCFHSAGQVH